MRRLRALALLAALIPASLPAQDYGALDMGLLTGDAAMAHVQRDAQRRAGLTPPNQRVGQVMAFQMSGQMSGRAAQDLPAVSGAYRPSPAVRQRLAGIMADGAEQRTPGTADEMRRLVLSGEAVRVYERVAPSLGYRANDAIDALAFYLITQWGVANDHRPDITRAQAAGVRRQAANAYAAVADQLGTDALRQEFGEMLAIQGAIMAGTHEAAVKAGDRARIAQYAALAREGGQGLFTMDPTTVALTDQGFRQR